MRRRPETPVLHVVQNRALLPREREAAARHKTLFARGGPICARRPVVILLAHHVFGADFGYDMVNLRRVISTAAQLYLYPHICMGIQFRFQAEPGASIDLEIVVQPPEIDWFPHVEELRHPARLRQESLAVELHLGDDSRQREGEPDESKKFGVEAHVRDSFRVVEVALDDEVEIVGEAPQIASCATTP